MELQTQTNQKSNIKLDITFIEQEEQNSFEKEIPRIDREARRGNWTGSQFKKLMTCSSSGSKLDWFNKQKVFYFSEGALKYIFSNAMERKTGRYILTDSTKEMKYGTKVEPLIFKRASEELKKQGLILEKVGYKPFPLIPTAGVTSDSIVRTQDGEIIASFESKACSSWTTLYDRTYERMDDSSTDFWQTQGQMLAWDVDENYYCVISPPQDINKYLYCEDIMNLYDEWCAETEMFIEIVKKSPIHLKCLEKRIRIAEAVVERFLCGEEENLKEVLYEEIDYFKDRFYAEEQEQESGKEEKDYLQNGELNTLTDFEGSVFQNENSQINEEQQEREKEVDMNDLPF